MFNCVCEKAASLALTNSLNDKSIFIFCESWTFWRSVCHCVTANHCLSLLRGLKNDKNSTTKFTSQVILLEPHFLLMAPIRGISHQQELKYCVSLNINGNTQRFYDIFIVSDVFEYLSGLLHVSATSLTRCIPWALPIPSTMTDVFLARVARYCVKGLPNTWTVAMVSAFMGILNIDLPCLLDSLT